MRQKKVSHLKVVVWAVCTFSPLYIGTCAVFAASFDCNKAKSYAEKTICATPELSNADNRLSELYKQAKAVQGNSKEFRDFVLKNWQKREACHDVACIEAWYSKSFDLYEGLLGSKRIADGPSLRPDKVQATTEKQALLDRIEKESAETILKSYYDDFDGDGVKEVFAITQKGQDGAHHIWYAGKTDVKEVKFDAAYCYYDSSDEAIVKVSKDQKIFIMECGNNGSGSFSVCCYVSSGKVKLVNQSMEGLTQLSEKEFAIHPSEFDHSKDGEFMTGHTYKRYYLKWDGNKFVEYSGIEISKKKLESYKNGRSVIENIKNEGYTIEKIYERSNGIININVFKRFNDESEAGSYDNVTLKLKEGKVTVVDADNPYNGSTDGIVNRSSYGGIYSASSGRL